MDPLCPQCRVPLVTIDAESARCPTIHAAKFRVLFKRGPRAAAAVTSTMPPVAPEPAMVTTATTPMDGITPEALESAPLPAPPVGLVSPPPVVAPALLPLAGMHCVQHPSVGATAQCRACGAYMCATCDFLLPGNIHLCPPCATRPETGLSPKRKKALVISSVLAVWGTVWMGLIFGGAFVGSHMNVALLGWIFILTVMIPSVSGLSVGWGAMTRRHSNPPLLWVATIWNGILLVAFLMLCIAGSLRR